MNFEASESRLQDNTPAPGGRWPRKVALYMTFFASLAVLALVAESRYGQRLLGDAVQLYDPAVAAGKPDAHADPRAPVLTAVEETGYRAVSEFVAKRYRVSRDVAFDLAQLAHRVGRELQLDPLLILAVISVESSFNPIAESGAGAKGLMQIIPKYHLDKLRDFGGAEAIFDPAINIQVGALILKEYIRHTGHLGIALQMYNGALNDMEDQYTNRVLTEKQRLQHVVSQTRRQASAVKTSSRGGGLPLN